MLEHLVTQAEDFSNREFPMTAANFKALSSLAYDHAGIVLGAHKQNLVYGRLTRRLRLLNLKNFDQYLALLAEKGNREFDEFLNAITTNLTSFFREQHHFDHLKNVVFPQLNRRRHGQLRFWSAGCSSGEEPYSLAMLCHQHLNDLAPLRILATDLDANILRQARAGIYDTERVSGLSKSMRTQFFDSLPGANQVKVKDSLKQLIRFNRLNLLGEWPIRVQFDLIFCRNVLIYFDKPTQQKLVSRFTKQLKPDGLLLIGHSENIGKMSDELKFIGQTMYQKVSS